MCANGRDCYDHDWANESDDAGVENDGLFMGLSLLLGEKVSWDSAATEFE